MTVNLNLDVDFNDVDSIRNAVMDAVPNIIEAIEDNNTAYTLSVRFDKNGDLISEVDVETLKRLANIHSSLEERRRRHVEKDKLDVYIGRLDENVKSILKGTANDTKN